MLCRFRLTQLTAPLCVGAVSLAATWAQAAEPAWIGARYGSLGTGAEVGVRVLPMVTVRAIGQEGTFSRDTTLDGLRYDGSLDLQSFGGQVDFKPILLPVYATVGAYWQNNVLTGRATPTSNVMIGTESFTPSEIGTLNTNISFGNTALYAGAGVEMGLGPVAAVLEAGVFVQGSPEVSLSATGSAANSSRFMGQIAAEQSAMAQDLGNLRTYPAITLQGRIRF